MEDTLTKPAGAAEAVEGEVAAALDGAAHAQTQTTSAVERALDAWRPDDPPAMLLAEFVALFNTDTRHDTATVSVPLGSADPAAVASYVDRAVSTCTLQRGSRRSSSMVKSGSSRVRTPIPWAYAETCAHCS